MLLIKIKNIIFKFIKSIFPTLIFILLLSLIFIYITKDGLKTAQKEIRVQVEGAVNTPGIKNLNANAITNDAVESAGGFLNNYDESYVSEKINMAKKLTDGEKIFIPFKKTEALSSEDNISKTGKININKADAKQLDLLPGVGAVTAQKIISGRPYAVLNDLVNKKILSNAVFEKIKDQIEI